MVKHKEMLFKSCKLLGTTDDVIIQPKKQQECAVRVYNGCLCTAEEYEKLMNSGLARPLSKDDQKFQKVKIKLKGNFNK